MDDGEQGIDDAACRTECEAVAESGREGGRGGGKGGGGGLSTYKSTNANHPNPPLRQNPSPDRKADKAERADDVEDSNVRRIVVTLGSEDLGSATNVELERCEDERVE